MYQPETEDLRAQMRRMVVSNLPYVIVAICGDERNKGNTHGYGVMKKVSKIFGEPLGPSVVYPCFKELKKKGVLISTNVFDEKNGKYRKVYIPKEPEASDFLKPFFRTEKYFHSIIGGMSKKTARNDLSAQLIIPDAMTLGVYKWFAKAAVHKRCD